jgi:hypothetical protein
MPDLMVGNVQQAKITNEVDRKDNPRSNFEVEKCGSRNERDWGQI